MSEFADDSDLQFLTWCATTWKFREIAPGETEDQYRTALADHVQPSDLAESQRIRNKEATEQEACEIREMLVGKVAERDYPPHILEILKQDQEFDKVLPPDPWYEEWRNRLLAQGQAKEE